MIFSSSRHSAHSRGFTLVEVAIVLVIIGLLTGGVLLGADLIDAATLRKQIKQVENYQAAVRLFKDKYQGIPGDFDKARSFLPITQFPSIANGDANGNILDASGTTATLFSGEIAQFWMQLSAAGLVEGSFDTTATLGTGWPEMAVGGGGVIGTYDSFWKYNMLYFGVSSVVSAADKSMIGSNSITAHDAWSIDQKIDDGHPLSGAMNARGSYAVTGLYNFYADYYDNVSWLAPERAPLMLETVFAWLVPAAHAGGAAVLPENACILIDNDASGSNSTDDASAKATYALDTSTKNCQFAVRFNKN